jgi:putative tryptophan/tyrosine transport system substrate-binding protein
MKRTISGMLLMFVFIWGGATEAQEPRAPKIGIVYTSPHPVINEIIDGFKETVLRQFPNAQFVERHANGNESEYTGAVLSVLSQHPTLLVPITTPISKIAVEEARGKTPIVFLGVTDPVGAGIVDSLEIPKKSTGSSDLCPFDALLSITHQLLPNAKVLAIPYNPSDQPAVFGLGRIRTLAPKFGFTVIDRQVTSRDELSTEVRGVSSRADAVLLAADNLMMENPGLVASAASSEGKPVFACDATSVQKGAVAGVSVKYRDVGRAGGELAVRVLNGAVPGSLPVAVLSSGGLIVNRQAACESGVALSPAVISGATVVNANYVCTTGKKLIAIGPMLWIIIAAAVGLTLIILLRRRSPQKV